MKLEALEHPKTLELADQLDIELPTAIGHLELLWAFVAKTTPNGAVGKYSNAVIADKARWRGKPATFVQALISVGFLDEDEQYRLLVHDWSEHCPNWVRAKLKRDGLNFAPRSILKTGTYEVDKDADLRAADKPQSSRARVLPSLAKPSQEKPSAQSAREPENVPHGTSAGNGKETSAVLASDTHRADAHDPDAFDADWLSSTWPETANNRNSVAAIHSAQGLVGMQLATWAQLRARVLAFAAYCAAGGLSDPSKVPGMARWFKHDDPERYWEREWPLPKRKASTSTEAAAAWDALLASDGAARDARIQHAITAVGGWSRIAERTTFEGPKIRLEFCRAFDDFGVPA